MQRILFRILPFAILVAAAGWVWLARRAASDLITLHAHDMELADVIRELEIQSWETILTRPGTAGRITLEVQNTPLTEVLERIAGQLQGRWSRVYALNSSAGSYRALRTALAEGHPTIPGWSRLNDRLHANPSESIAPKLDALQRPVSMHWEAEPVETAALALGRLARVVVLVEDGTEGRISLDAHDNPLGSIAEQMAEQVHRRCSLFYLLEAGQPSQAATAARP